MNLLTKQAVKERASGRCERCGKRAELHVHHLTYERNGNELESDLIALCLDCHGAEHPRHTFHPLSKQRQIASRREKHGGERAVMRDVLRGSRKRHRKEDQIRQNRIEARRLG